MREISENYMVSQYGNTSKLDPKHGITVASHFLPKNGTNWFLSDKNWNPYNGRKKE